MFVAIGWGTWLLINFNVLLILMCFACLIVLVYDFYVWCAGLVELLDKIVNSNVTLIFVFLVVYY